jgi:hypothetical protein
MDFSHFNYYPSDLVLASELFPDIPFEEAGAEPGEKVWTKARHVQSPEKQVA